MEKVGGIPKFLKPVVPGAKKREEERGKKEERKKKEEERRQVGHLPPSSVPDRKDTQVGICWFMK